MAGLSVTRRRKAWIKGVICGATGRGGCPLRVPKLQEIFQRGIDYGRANATSAVVQSMVEQHKRRTSPRATSSQRPRRPVRRFGDRPSRY